MPVWIPGFVRGTEKSLLYKLEICYCETQAILANHADCPALIYNSPKKPTLAAYHECIVQPTMSYAGHHCSNTTDMMATATAPIET